MAKKNKFKIIKIQLILHKNNILLKKNNKIIQKVIVWDVIIVSYLYVYIYVYAYLICEGRV